MVEGWGKTSLAAQAPSPVFIQTRGETGLETLIDAGRLPDVPHFPESQTWEEMLDAVRVLLNEQHQFRTLVIDTLNGAEKLCHDYVCRKQFNGDWGEHGFTSYAKGYEVALPEWTMLLSDLDRLREQKHMSIVGLCHTRVKPFKNPAGADYDRYSPDMHEKTWGLSHKWADVVFFGNFETVVLGGQVREDGKHKKGKVANGNTSRMIYAERRAAFDAKNRLGLPAEFEVSSESPTAAWANVIKAIKEARAAA